MRQFYYSLQILTRGKGSNVIKVISLAMGLTVSIILFTRIAFDLNYDRFYKEPDHLYQIKAGYRFGEKPETTKTTIGGKFAGAIAESFPDEIASTTVAKQWGGHSLYNGSIRFAPFMLIADTLFFETMGLKVLKGNPRDLSNPDRLFLSEDFARRIFGNDDPVGKVLTYEYRTPMIVSGIYENVPENSSIGQYEAIISFPTLVKNQWGYIGWDGGDSFLSYARLKDKKFAGNINQRLEQAISHYLPPTLDFSYTTEIIPISRVHTDIEDVQRMMWIMGILAFSILLTVTLNYVLMAVSSLASRAKGIGVHKCNGASGKEIFGMFFWETLTLVGLSLLLMLFLLFNFQDWIEDTINAPFRSLFSIQHIWAPVLVLCFLIIVGSVLPGRLFSQISATQLFRSSTDGKRGWKHVLLFMQFMGASFIFGLLFVIWVQHYHLIHKELGCSPQQVVYAKNTFKHPDQVRVALSSLPYVEAVASSGLPLVGGYSGWSGVSSPDGASNFSPRYTTYDSEYLSLMNIKLKEGRSLLNNGEILINETFVKLMHWNESPIGQSVDRFGVVVGVMEDFASDDFYSTMQPVAIGFQRECNTCVHVKLKAPFSEHLQKLNEVMLDVFPQEDVFFLSLEQELLGQYKSVHQFRDATLMASVTVLFLLLMGLIGYTNDEVCRRSKEIAIRKVNGAEATQILFLLSKSIMYVAVPSALLGVTASWYIASIWIDMFAEKINLSAPLFIGIGLGVLAVIVGCVLVKSWRIANENPVNSIKNE